MKKVWIVAGEYVPLHPQSREMRCGRRRGRHRRGESGGARRHTGPGSTEKNFAKHLEVWEGKRYLCTTFPEKTPVAEILERVTYKRRSSTRKESNTVNRKNGIEKGPELKI